LTRLAAYIDSSAQIASVHRRLAGCGKTPCQIRHRFDFL
jgi:hypothetical protein